MVLAAAMASGCGASTGHSPEDTPVSGGVNAAPTGNLNTVVSGGAKDSTESIPGSPTSPYVYRFRMTDPSGSGFNFQDRDLSFYFRPGPDALYFQVENRQNRIVTIDWERSVFYGPNGGSDKVAHNTTRWEDRFQSQANTQIAGLQRFGDSMFPMTYLYDPATQKGHYFGIFERQEWSSSGCSGSSFVQNNFESWDVTDGNAPVRVASSQIRVVIPGTASCLTRNSGRKKEWMTSLE